MLVCAVLRGGECVLELLIQAGADLNHKDPRTVGGYPTRAPWATRLPQDDVAQEALLRNVSEADCAAVGPCSCMRRNATTRAWPSS